MTRFGALWRATGGDYFSELEGCALSIRAQSPGIYRFRVESHDGWGWRQGVRETLEEAMKASTEAARGMLSLTGPAESVAA